MTNRLYFTDPVQAIYMMKEFGVKFETDGFDFRLFDAGTDSSVESLLHAFNNEYPKKIYVARESEHIFEPQKGDVGLNLSGNAIGIAIDDEDYELRCGAQEPARFYEVIMRDNKHFFNAENETI